jgi:hypothetical protein
MRTLPLLNRNRRRSAKRPSFPLEMEILEQRLVPAGTWTPLSSGGPGGTALLMTDGSVLATDGGSGWYRLTPNASGSYVNGTWTAIASANDSRLYMGSVVLPDGRLFVTGGEYGTGGGTAEIYDPQSNTWTRTAPPLGYVADSNAVLLHDGRVLVVGNYTAPMIYDPASNSWSYTGPAVDGFVEQSLALLPNANVLTVDGDGTAQMYVPSEDRWLSAGNTPTNMVGPGSEFGPGLLLPDGRAFFVGGNGTTAYYTPGPTVNDPGSWQAGPSLPGGLLADDAPGAVMPNGHVLLEGEVSQFAGPGSYFDFDPGTNTYTPLPAPYGGATGGTTYPDRMLVLPTGQILWDDSFVYTPDSGPNPAWQPTIAGMSANADGSYHLSGMLLNGVSFGAGYGDDATMASNYPLVQLTDGSGNVTYARTFNWAPGEVGNQGTMATDFALPTGLPAGTYSLRVVADGIASAPVSFSTTSTAPAAPTNLTATAGNAQVALTWGPSSGASSYNLYRGTSSGSETLIATGIAGTSYTDTGRTNGDNYYYEVTAVNSVGESGFSNEASAWPQAAGGTIWVEDATPLGATLAADGGDAWTWSISNPAPYSGSLDQQSTLAAGEHQHYFYNATQTMTVNAGDTLYAYVYLNPASPPQEVMLQWNVNGSWEHRAYWGADDIGWGTDGTVSRQYMGALPATGGWVRLAVPASVVGLDGATVNGMAFTLYGGQADWDQAGTVSAPAAPTGLTASAGNGQVTLSWNASTGAGSYNVYRSTSSGTELLVASGISGTGYTDGGLSNGTTYYYEVTAVNGNGESALSGEVSATPQAAAAGSAAFVGNDASTQGTWQAAYGADGYDIGQFGASLPSYATVNISGNANYVWNGSTSDSRALQEPGSSNRLAACWYSGSSFTIDVNITDGQTHQVALYALDWDSYGPRQEQIDVIDPGTGRVLDSETVSNFSGGQYLVWNVSGHVQFQVNNLVGGSNAVISGIFFGGAAVSAGSASFVGTDASTQGTWQAAYGSDGYDISQFGASLPSYATVNISGNANYVWNGSTSDSRALQEPGSSNRLAACWYSGSSLTIDVNISDGQTHQVALYALDWDSYGPRQEQIDVIDPVTGRVLDRETVSNFSGGQYLVWNVSGHVRFQVTNLVGGSNAVISGVFFGPGAAASTPVNLSSAYNREGIVSDGMTFGGGFDGDGYALSANLLGSAVTWNGQSFQLGTANTTNVVSATGQTINLPAGNFATLSFLAAGVNGNQADQTFTVTYSDGTTQTFTQSISDWYTPQGYAGESTAVSLAYRNTSGGGTQNGPFNVYGYQFALNSSKTVQSITLPNNANVEILAMNLTV